MKYSIRIRPLFLVITFFSLFSASASAQLDNGAVFTPDGKAIIFHSYRDGAGEIVEMNLITGERRQITMGDNNDRWPRISPDGKQILFMSTRDGSWKIYRINRDGGGLILLTDEPGMHLGASWSPDGSGIVYSQQRADQDGMVSDLYRATADGKHKKKLVENAVWPNWSRDGKTIYFTRPDNDGGLALGAWDIASNKLHILTDPAMSSTGAGLSSDGNSLFISAIADGQRTLHRMKTDGTHMENLGIPAKIDSNPQVSPDGKTLMFAHNPEGNDDIFLLDLATMRSRNLTR